MYDQDLLARYGLVSTGSNAGPMCIAEWSCPTHGLICELAKDHDGDHLCSQDDEYRHRWARVERRTEARLQAMVETTPDVD